MAFDRETITKILDAADIVAVIGEYVNLKKSGANYKGLCPFHQEKTPSFTVSEEKQLFHCFGCGEGGDVFGFIMKIENFTFNEAITFLAEKFGISLKNLTLTPEKVSILDEMFKVNNRVAEYYHNFLLKSEKAQKAREYLLARNFDLDDLKTFQIGFAPKNYDTILNLALKNRIEPKTLELLGLIRKNNFGKFNDWFVNRVIFPIKNAKGKVIAFGGRVLDDSLPKYLNSPETEIFKKNASLYGIDIAIQHIKSEKKAIILEGYIDVMALHKFGIKNSVATLGTALTENHINFIKKYTDEIILLFDGDAAGIKASLRSVDLFANLDLYLKIALIPEKLDPDEFLKKYGKEKFLEILKNSEDGFLYKINFFAKNKDFSKLKDRENFLAEVFEMCANIENKLRVNYILKNAADLLKEKEDEIKLEFKKFKQSIRKFSQTKVSKENEAKISAKPKFVFNTLEQDFLEFLIANPKKISEAKKIIDTGWIFSMENRQIIEYLFKNCDNLLSQDLTPMRILSTLALDLNLSIDEKNNEIYKILTKSVFTKNFSDDINDFVKKLEQKFLENKMMQLSKSDNLDDILEHYYLAKKVKSRGKNEIKKES